MSTGNQWFDPHGVAYAAPAQGSLTMVTGTVYPGGRGVLVDCTAGGNVVLKFVNGSSITVAVATDQLYQFNWNIIQVVSKTATATISLLI